jgi:endonuclease G
MNGERRLAFFTAVNLDGSRVVTINRQTGEITAAESMGADDEGAEAYERWWPDDRIDERQRSDQSLYDDDALSDFQRGHLVKRTDPSWGTPAAATKGQADTFHFTNCAPQHKNFNPNAKRWAGLENWITKGSDDEDMRVTVFSGPVFGKRDPKRGYIRVPLRFWKVVARVVDGELLATAVVADQTDLVTGGEEKAWAEDLPEMPPLVKTHQVPVATIEKLTALDFGPLRDHDTFESGSEGAERAGGAEGAGDGVEDLGPRRLIRTFADLQVHSARREASRVRATTRAKHARRGGRMPE